jgi:hypothetical protein
MKAEPEKIEAESGGRSQDRCSRAAGVGEYDRN